MYKIKYSGIYFFLRNEYNSQLNSTLFTPRYIQIQHMGNMHIQYIKKEEGSDAKIKSLKRRIT